MAVSIDETDDKLRIVLPPARDRLVFLYAGYVFAPVTLIFAIVSVVGRSVLVALGMLTFVLLLLWPYIGRVIWEIAGVEEIVVADRVLEVRRLVWGRVIRRKRYNLFEMSSLIWIPSSPLPQASLRGQFLDAFGRWNLGNAWSYGHKLFFVYHDRARSFGWNLKQADVPVVVDALVRYERRMREHYGLPMDKGLGQSNPDGLNHALWETLQDEPLPWTRMQ